MDLLTSHIELHIVVSLDPGEIFRHEASEPPNLEETAHLQCQRLAAKAERKMERAVVIAEILGTKGSVDATYPSSSKTYVMDA